MVRAAVFLLTILPAAAIAESLRLPVTADVGICAYPAEQSINTGARAIVRIKGLDHYYLFSFDAAPLAGRQVVEAALHLKLVRGNLRRLAFCTVPIAWTEGPGRNEPQKGAPCFTHVRYPDEAWTPFGGTILDATFNNPHMRWSAADATTDRDGWATARIDPALVQAVATGLSHGLLVSDEKGQTFENHDIYAREQSGSRPYLTAQCQPVPPGGADLKRAPPRAEPMPASSFLTGAVRVDTGDPFPKATVEVLGHRVRIAELGLEAVTLRDNEVVFEGLPAGRECTVTVETFVGPQAFVSQPVKVRASSALAMPPPPAPKPPDSTPRQFRRDGWLVELHPAVSKIAPDASPLEQDRRWPVPSVARNAWAGLQAVIFPPGGKCEGVSLELSAPAWQGGQDKQAPPLEHADLYRIWCVLRESAPHAEVLVPVRPGDSLAAPWKENKVAGQTCQAVFVDVWVPKDAAPGRYEGRLTLRQAGREIISAPIRLDVSAVALDDVFLVAGDCNTYGSPAGAMGAKTSDPQAFLEAERKYYRLAHAHRMTLNCLPYTQAGEVNWHSAPKTAGSGKDIRLTDWSEWDGRYGPLLSGQAFSEQAGYVGPGRGVPVRHMYLPFHENWPCALAANFQPWPPPKDYQEFLRWSAALPAVGGCLSRGFQDAWPAALKQFDEHIQATGWTRTRYQVYLNNKHYFRNPKSSSGRGISLWLLDEPVFADDFLALRHFGRLSWTSRVFDYTSPRFEYRIDLSRPTHERGWLTPYTALFVLADQLHSQRRWVQAAGRGRAEFWNYAMPPSFQASNAAWAAWPIQSYCWGAAGTLPWQTIASDGDLDQADETALMYPPQRFGLDRPLASLRMKAWRDGLQDAELLRQLRQKRNWNDLQLRAFVGQAMGLNGWRDGMDPMPDAPIVTFKGADAWRLDSLRRAAIVALGE